MPAAQFTERRRVGVATRSGPANGMALGTKSLSQRASVKRQAVESALLRYAGNA